MAATKARIVSGLIGSAPQPKARIRDKSQRAICSGLARLVISAYAKLGANVSVPRCLCRVSSQMVAFLMKLIVAMNTAGMRKQMGAITNPISPMSWYSGSHERVQLAERDWRVERYRDQSTPERAEECRDELFSLGYHQRYPVAAPEPGRQVMSCAPLGGEAKIMKGNEEILAGTSGAYEGETARMLAFASVQGRDDADHGRPV